MFTILLAKTNSSITTKQKVHKIIMVFRYLQSEVKVENIGRLSPLTSDGG